MAKDDKGVPARFWIRVIAKTATVVVRIILIWLDLGD
jgi:hypothetical protein